MLPLLLEQLQAPCISAHRPIQHCLLRSEAARAASIAASNEQPSTSPITGPALDVSNEATPFTAPVAVMTTPMAAAELEVGKALCSPVCSAIPTSGPSSLSSSSPSSCSSSSSCSLPSSPSSYSHLHETCNTPAASDCTSASSEQVPGGGDGMCMVARMPVMAAQQGGHKQQQEGASRPGAHQRALASLTYKLMPTLVEDQSHARLLCCVVAWLTLLLLAVLDMPPAALSTLALSVHSCPRAQQPQQALPRALAACKPAGAPQASRCMPTSRDKPASKARQGQVAVLACRRA